MNWAEFKEAVEAFGVTDDMDIVSIGYIGSEDKDVGLFIDGDSFSVYGESERDEIS